jgi:hypothetical protein
MKILSFLLLLNVVFAQKTCLTIEVKSGTSCEWMCNYCKDYLNTSSLLLQNTCISLPTGDCVSHIQKDGNYTCCTL